MIRLLRGYLVPLLFGALVGATFARAYSTADLLAGSAAPVLAGWSVAVATHHLRRVVHAPMLRWLIGAALTIGGFALALAVVSPSGMDIEAVGDAINTFFVVGLPAQGLTELAVVILVVAYPVSVITTWASLEQRTLTTVAVPLTGLIAAAVLVAPVGILWWVPVGLGALVGAVLIIDARSDLADLPALTDDGVVEHHRVDGWRWGGQIVPVVLAVLVVVAWLPVPEPFDVRRFIDPPTERVEDLNPLAVAARWNLLDDPEPAASIEVRGDTPGRLRLAVLDEYDDTGWRQSADFAVTGDTLVADPLFPDAADEAGPERSHVTVDLAEGLSSFRGVPTAGTPVLVDEPRDMRFAASPGILLRVDGSGPVTYEAIPGPLEPPAVAAPPVASFPEHLVACPASESIRDVAAQLTADTTSATERLARIEGWLLTRRIYDREAPGGQTIASIERFVSQPFARGNLEVFVSSYAVLARCSGVPARVVVGFPAPATGTTDYAQDDVSVWVETPLTDNGWVPFDPVPTPEEQRLLAQQAADPPPPPTTEPPPAEPPPTEVEPLSPAEPADRTTELLVVAIVVAAVLLVGLWLWAVVIPRLVVRRRRHTADPAEAVAAAWATACDALIDRGVDLVGSNTPSETARHCAGSVAPAVQWLIAGLGPLVDRARYGGGTVTPEDAGQAWAYTSAILDRLPSTRSKRLAPVRHPRRAARRIGSVRGLERVRAAWSGSLPDTALLSGSEAPADIPDVEVQARIGDGSTGTVYRGVHLPTTQPVAVKVFRFGPADSGFDRQRFDWEVRVAQGVSGLPHLPEVLDAGITPVTERAFLVSTLYEEGTLLDRVRRGGPMTSAEAIEIGSDLAMALDALHQLGVIHGDVKPENVFAGNDGWILGDLGSAWLRASRGPAASLTPPYAAPEVWRGASPTPSADLYSLALTILFACTAAVPIAGNPPSLAEIETAFPDHPIVARALDPNARRRPRGVAEFARKLQPDLVVSKAARTRTLNLPTPTVSHSRGTDRNG